jgi:hypothetical protein
MSLTGKQKRFVRKFMTGVNCRPGARLRWFVLTESDEALEKRLRADWVIKHLVQQIRRELGRDFEYCLVKHLQGEKKRFNWHLIYYGTYIDQLWLENYWNKHYCSHITGMEEIRSPMASGMYVAGYVGNDEKFISAQFSRGWVFPKWWDFSRWWKKSFGRYPELGLLDKYSHMSDGELKKDIWYSEYLDFKWRKEKDARMFGFGRDGMKKDIPLYKRVLAPSEYEVVRGNDI